METNEVKALKEKLERLENVNRLMSKALYNLKSFIEKYENMRLDFFDFGERKNKSLAVINKALGANSALSHFEESLSAYEFLD